MTAMFGVRKRAEEFAVALDGNPDATALRPELRELVGVASGLREHAAPPPPRPEFVASLREQLMAEADTVLTRTNAGLALPVRTRGPRERRMVAAAAAVVLVGGTGGLAAAAQEALPGQALYPIKRGIEQAQTGLSVTPAGKGRHLLGQADDRLGEVQGLLASNDLGSAPQVPATLDAFAQQATEGAELMMDSYQQTQDTATIAELHSFTVSAVGTLERLAATAPEEAQSDLASAAMTLRDIDTRAIELCSTCADDLPPLDIPPFFLASAEASRALFAIPLDGLDNSHPVTLGPGMAPQHDAGTGAGTGSGTKGDASPGGSDSSTTKPGSTGTGTPGSSAPGVDLGVPDVNEPATKNKPAVPKDVKPPKAVTDPLGDGLGDLTETLLPDLP